jgi:hypothetical protein
LDDFFGGFRIVSLVGPSGDVVGCSAFDSTEDFAGFRCLVVEILKKAKMAKMGEFELVLWRFAFVSLVKPSGDVGGCSAFDSCEDLGRNGGLGVEIWEKPKKFDFSVAFRRFGFVSLVVPSGDVGGCYGGDGVVDFAAG